MKSLTIIALFCAIWIPCASQTRITRIDSLAQALFSRHELHGNVMVAENGIPLYQKSFGYADQSKKIMNSDESTFDLASVSKTFTSIAILQLKEKGKLKLDDPVVKFLPDLPYPTVTIRHLLSHTSGLTDFQIFEEGHRADTSKIFTNADVIPALKKSKGLLFQPGEKWSYSNPGYALLALIIEKVSGRSFSQYLSQNIFNPAGMTQTYIATSLQKNTDPHKSHNYDPVSYSPSTLINTDSLRRYRIPLVVLGSIIGPGKIVSSIGDMLKYDQALYGTKLLRAETLEEAFQPTILTNGKPAETGWKNTRSNYGLGWMILLDKSHGRTVFHSGGIIGAVSMFMRNTDKKQTIILLDNVTHRGLHSEGVNFLNLLNGSNIFSDKQSLSTIYAELLTSKGADYAAARFHELKTDTSKYFYNEMEFNSLGLDMLYNGKLIPQSLEILKLNCFLFPKSFNVYDSYGAALAIAGKKEEAIMMYRKSVEINPENREGSDALKQLGGGGR